MKNKLLAAPYIVWMALFIVVPLGIVVYYAVTDSITGQFTLANITGMGALPVRRGYGVHVYSSIVPCLLLCCIQKYEK